MTAAFIAKDCVVLVHRSCTTPRIVQPSQQMSGEDCRPAPAMLDSVLFDTKMLYVGILFKNAPDIDLLR